LKRPEQALEDTATELNKNIRRQDLSSWVESQRLSSAEPHYLPVFSACQEAQPTSRLVGASPYSFGSGKLSLVGFGSVHLVVPHASS